MRVESLHCYPLKSARAIDLTKATVESRGLRHDRRWMLVDDNGRFISQREQPRLAAIATQVNDAGALTVSTGDMPPLHIPAPPATAERFPVTVWKQQAEAYDAGLLAHGWFQDYLGISCRLVFQGGLPRSAPSDYTPAGSQTSFADDFPLLVATTASLEDLNTRLETPLPMNRFRPNIVIGGTAPWAEDEWKTIRIGGIDISIAKPCARCIVTTTDQQSGERQGTEPLRSLKDFRLLRKPGITGVIFAQNAVPLGTGRIQTGDTVEILETAPSPFAAS
jgi:uncharacterized protein YcbX